MAPVTVTCSGCGATFQRASAELARQRKRSGVVRVFCSRRCYAVHRGKHNLAGHLGAGRPQNLRVGSRRDAFSPFRYFMRKARNRPYPTDLDLPYLRDLGRANEADVRCPVSR